MPNDWLKELSKELELVYFSKDLDEEELNDLLQELDEE